MSYVERERTMSPPVLAQIANSARTSARSSTSPLRQRGMNRASTFSDSNLQRSSSLTSNFSDSVNDAGQSIKTTTDNLFLPRAKSPDVLTGHEPSHWHSVPLALALLPAIGGLLFEKGSAVVTDVTLLSLAAIFLNWSVRLPWDWYHSAQAINVQEDYPSDNIYNSDAVIEEDDEGNDRDSRPGTPSHPQREASPPKSTPNKAFRSATSELRFHELLALATCFLAPLVGAWLLHHIRAQLSRPSEGLVSNYNLTIFLLASELRPLSHLIKLVQARTLHLQRTVSTNPYVPANDDATASLSPSSTIKELASRLTELETHIADSATSPTSPKNMLNQLPEITASIRQSLQPDLDALNRAVRRYEKRSVLLSMQTEKRLQDLEARMGDAITLAAAAERSSQSKRRRGSGSGVMLVMDGVAKMLLLPVQIALSVLSLPGQVLGVLVRYAEDAVGKRVRREMRTAGRGDARGANSAGGGGGGGSGGGSAGGGSASASEREREKERERRKLHGGLSGRGVKKAL